MNTQQENPDKALVVAKYLIYKSHKAGKKGMTNKKLQKLLYYSQAWSLVLNNAELFSDDFQAWIHGPAIPKIYFYFKKYGYGEIMEEVKEEDLATLTKDELEVLEEVLRVYGKFDANYLENLTHNEEPWLNARQDVNDFDPSMNVISKESMKQYYKKLQEENGR